MKYKKTVIALGFLLFLGACLFVSYLYYAADDGPPQDADLRYTRPAVPFEENGFHELQFAEGEIWWPEGIEDREMGRSEGWDSAAAAEILRKNEEALARVDEALKKPRIQMPEVASMEARMPYLMGWRSIADLFGIRVSALLQEGKEGEALDEAMKVVRMGHLIATGDGVLIQHLVRLAIKSVGLEQVSKVLNRGKLGGVDLEPYLGRLAAYPAERAGLVTSLKLEYRLTSRTMEMLAGNSAFGRLQGSNGLRIFLNPNRTKGLLADGYRTMIEAAGKIPEEARSLDSLKSPPDERLIFIFPRKNMVGIVISNLLLGTTVRAVEKLRSEELLVSKTMVLLACKIHAQKNGKLPASLADLVPRYLKEVPRDPYDGKPLRYSAERKIIWSVGEDLVDAGGSEEEPEAAGQFDPAEPTFKIES